ncbi:MAG: bifunctional UDP-sugar hydrolase/5'-nucleotidase UshA [Gammaproteobacteria bacterium]|nr:bifunctional UDP-sugar hydrolase/5'-nucleotidase UshA [Gammaproteobacteria bacterium]
MTHFIKRGLILSCIAGLALAGQNAIASTPDQTYNLTILHTNDNHGRFWPNRHGEYGMAARAALIQGIRDEVASNGGHTLLLSGGDINTGVPESDLQDAEPDFKGMNYMSYDAMALGNHEFDNPMSVLRQQYEWARFPFLSANILNKDTGMPLFKSHEMFNLDGLKVAVVGFTTEDTIRIGNPEFLGGVEIQSPVEVAKELIPELAANSDLVVAITHMGHYRFGDHGGNAAGDVTLAKAVEGLDVIVGGHSQTPTFSPDVQNNTLIVQAKEWGKYVGRLDLQVRNGAISVINYELIPVNLKKKVKINGEKVRVFIDKEIIADETLQAILEPYQNQGQEQLTQVIGNADEVFIGAREQVRTRETNLGNLIALAQMARVQADVGIMNSGGIRADMPAGDITYKDVLTVQPFANTVAYVDLSGAELMSYLEAAANKAAGSGAFAQFAGVKITMTGDNMTSAAVAGKAVEPTQTYRVAVNAYMASGGDGYPRLSDHANFVNSGFVDAEVLKDYISNHSPLKTADYAAKGDVTRN